MRTLLNWKNETVSPSAFAVIAWGGKPAVYAFASAEAMRRSIGAAKLCHVEAREVSAHCAETLLMGGFDGRLHEVSCNGVAAFGNLKLAA
ncbi:hypothetical protein [Mesorhizobium sp. M1B.F.Ca.ET.045.04.1.1]|uniref:hypothetical protein n=1 Tax=Mesorhizobium sp. M1B.F.Ca.ET.045.04.1.1 TaxID=2493673 RepID=UPI000F75F72D|nr:hypothetical protein [Mesorhizobium sp. M1B.F.Ca.ET.045.04.1.1]AZO29375.1 hypothetical protein EJ071_19610 [Mesorhizobium sp. M1B.F.Ca.ET.045.04.1.1]